MNLFILCPERSFLTLATALGAYGVRPDHVRACVFPGRPEPRSAQFVGVSEHATYFHYRYMPDLGVRALLVQRHPLPGLPADSHLGLEDLLGAVDDVGEGPWFERWSVLRQDLLAEGHLRAQRAAACWRLRGQWASASREDEQVCLEVLLGALREGSRSARRAVAEQLIAWPRKEARAALMHVRHEDPDVEVRMHAHRAIEQLDVQSL